MLSDKPVVVIAVPGYANTSCPSPYQYMPEPKHAIEQCTDLAGDRVVVQVPVAVDGPATRAAQRTRISRFPMWTRSISFGGVRVRSTCGVD